MLDVVSLGLYQGESWAWGKTHVLLNHLNHCSGFLWLLVPVHAALGQVYTALKQHSLWGGSAGKGLHPVLPLS